MSLLLLFSGTQTPNPTGDLDLLYRPVRDEIARRIRARVYARGGKVGTFTDATEPTADEVDKLIDDAAAFVAGKVGINLPEQIWPIARRVVATKTCMLIEAGSRDYNAQRYKDFRDDYKDALAELVEAKDDLAEGGEVGDDASNVSPVGCFPPAPCDDDYDRGCHVPGTENPWPC